MRWWLLCVALAPLSAAPASACGNGKVLLSDSFDTLQSMWGDANDNVKVVDGRLQLSAAAGESYTAYAGPTFDDMDVCARVKLVRTDDATGAYVGLMFWTKDAENFYTFQITLDGYATVYQQVNKEWKAVIKDRQVDSVHQGSTRFNELEVVTRGHRATFYINGQRFDDISGLEPDGRPACRFRHRGPRHRRRRLRGR
jgi:hypothetical protein